VDPVTDSELAFEYDLRPLPLGRFTFRRWRWELWHGAVLRASGWRTSPAHAEHALRTAASYWAHEVAGVRALRPELARSHGSFGTGGVVRVESGSVRCLLLPRGDEVALEATG
jgi:hypothetical protein